MNYKILPATAIMLCAGTAMYAADTCTVTGSAFVATIGAPALAASANVAATQYQKQIAAVEIYVTQAWVAPAAKRAGVFCPIGPIPQAFACSAAYGGFVDLDSHGNITNFGCNGGSARVGLKAPTNLPVGVNPLPLPLPAAVNFLSAYGNLYAAGPVKEQWTSTYVPGKSASYNAAFKIQCLSVGCANGTAGGKITNGAVVINAGAQALSLTETAGLAIPAQ